MITDLLGHPLMPVQEFPTPRRPGGLVKGLATRLRKILTDHAEFGACSRDGWISAFVHHGLGALAHTAGYSPDFDFRTEAGPARGSGCGRAAEARPPAPAGPPVGTTRPKAHP